MTLRILASTALAAVVAAAFAGTAAAIPTADDDAPLPGDDGSELVWDVAESDLTVLCSTDAYPSSDSLAGSGGTATTTLSSTSVGSMSDSAESEGDACAVGELRPSCRRVTVTVKKRTAFWLSVAFEWVVEKEWCWAYPRVTWWRTRTYLKQADPYMVYRGIVSRFDAYYTWCCFSTRSGHTSYRMARLDNCIPLKGCIGSWYPRVQIHVHGNGTFSVPVKGV